MTKIRHGSAHAQGKIPFSEAIADVGFLIPDGHSYVLLPSGLVHPIDSPAFRDYLRYKIFQAKGEAPEGRTLEDAIRTYAAYAQHEGETHSVYLRVAKRGTVLYLDLGDPSSGEVIEIDEDGWRPGSKERRTFDS